MKFLLTAFRAVHSLAALPFVAVALALATPDLKASTVTVLHAFDAVNAPVVYNSPDGFDTLVRGNDGNLYGLTYYGGTNNTGTAFKITPGGTFTVLYNFSALADMDSSGRGDNRDGAHPVNALVPVADGSLYGITAAGGSGRYGTFFKITPDGTLTTLYSFTASDPAVGIKPLVRGTDGNFYGTSGYSDYQSVVPGAMFSLTPDGTLTVLHNFNALTSAYSNVNDGGASPNGLIQANDGNFYGTTAIGGTHGAGTIFKVTSAGVLTTLYNFNAFQTPTGVTGVNKDGGRPLGGLVQGPDGNFYGTSSQGTSYGRGNIFQVTPDGTYTSFYAFGDPSEGVTYDDGGFPYNLVLGSDGVLYGTTGLGSNMAGVLFKITLAGEFSVVHTFPAVSQNAAGTATNSEGYAPNGLVEGNHGIFYGQSDGAGPNGAGTVVQFDSHRSFFDGETVLNNNVMYLRFPTSSNVFGYYAFLSDPNYIYHFDLGYEYVFDADDSEAGVYLYDFKSGSFFYTSPTFPFPYLYDFSLNTTLYYYPDPKNPGRYNTNGTRYFYNFSTGKIISK